MRRLALAFILGFLFMLAAKNVGFAQNTRVVADCANTGLTWTAGDIGRPILLDTNGRPCAESGNDYPLASTPITGNAAGTTGAVVGTLAAAVGKTTYICGFNVQSIGGTATSGPVTVAGLVGSSQVYRTDVNSATVGKQIAAASFFPCIPASATNTAITVTTTANGTATGVNVNSWGFQL